MELSAVTFYQHLKKIVPEPEQVVFLLAVSGGKDSSAMVHLFSQCGLKIAMAHCNFHLRGEASNRDMEWVKKMSETYHCKLYIQEFDTISEQADSGKSIEMVARDLRYHWFREIGKPYHYIVTAHHANDNVETLLLNLSRGTGLKGLTGIPTLSGQFLRPLLPFTSDQIEKYIADNQIDYCTDATNFSEQYQRNKIRLSVIPKLREINPELIDTFTQNIARFSQQYNFYSRQILHFQNEITFCENDICYISIEKLLPNKDKELLLYEFLKPYNFRAAVVQDIIRHLSDEPGKVFYSASHELLKDRKYLIVKEIKEINFFSITIESSEELEKYGFSITRHEKNMPLHFEDDPRILYVDAEHFHFPVVIRHWEKGDYFYPLGLRGKKKISDFFVDKKTDLFAKKKIKLLCIDNQIVWVIGQRADDRFKIKEKTFSYYKIVYHGRI